MTNYEKFYGTPQRAAETITVIRNAFSDAHDCTSCPLRMIEMSYFGTFKTTEKAMLEWLSTEEGKEI